MKAFHFCSRSAKFSQAIMYVSVWLLEPTRVVQNPYGPNTEPIKNRQRDISKSNKERRQLAWCALIGPHLMNHELDSSLDKNGDGPCQHSPMQRLFSSTWQAVLPGHD